MQPHTRHRLIAILCLLCITLIFRPALALEGPGAGIGRALTVVVDLNSPKLDRPLQPKHEVAFQLEARNTGRTDLPSARVAPGGVVEVFRLDTGGKLLPVATLRCSPQNLGTASKVAPGGYLYRQLFIWPGWRGATPGHYLARYQSEPGLQVKFQMP